MTRTVTRSELLVSPNEKNSSAKSDPRFTGKSLYFVGIGGCGMSGLALTLKKLGAVCTGSDATPSDFTGSLEKQGIQVAFNQDGSSFPAACDLVIASAAIHSDHPEVRLAIERGIPVWTYAEALGKVQESHTGISIAGTHGKSTITAMLAYVLLQCGFDPGFIVGANCPQIGGGSRVGSNATLTSGPYKGRPGILLAEACEFNRSFHHHRPCIGLINNIEEDHLDIYGSLDEVIKAFKGFAGLIPSAAVGGHLLIAHDGAHRTVITSGLKCNVTTFGFHPEADLQISFDPENQVTTVNREGVKLASWSCSMTGAHNALNSSAAAILANLVGAEWLGIAKALQSFHGVDRRMQRLGERRVNGGTVVVYDDYGHHPTEIDQTLHALRAAENPERLICVFQPHQHSRTRFLMEQFARSFSSADVVVVPHIYFVRDSEVEKTKVSAADLVDRLRKQGVAAMHVYPFDAIVEQLEIMARPGDLIVIMGAGPVWKVAIAFMNSGNV